MSAASEHTGRRRGGGKEEIRASVLRTYLLRLRHEGGPQAVEAWLAEAGIDPEAAQNETAWVSAGAAKRALHALAARWGERGLLERGEWATHPDALGTWVRMLREAKTPADGFRFFATHAREVTRVGAWESFDVPDSSRGSPGKRGKTARARLVYRAVDPSGDDGHEPVDTEGEALLCAARRGELASLPRIWGCEPATVEHPTCIAKGDPTCTYEVSWRVGQRHFNAALAAVASFVGCGATVWLAGGWIAGATAAVLGGALGGVAGMLRDRGEAERRERTFERNRIAALERGLELRGEVAGTPSDLAGAILGGKFRIGKKIGSGGIGVVYAAEHVTLGHEVAIKVLRGAAARDGGEIARLRREAYIQVHVDHPNVARVLDLDQMPDGSIYVVMERLTGQSLADKLAKDGLLAPAFAVRTFIDVARGLAAAHAQGAVHRDLKPANIFLCDDGVAKLLDFGMSKLAAAESLTQAGYTLGTPEYMAPEQCIGASVDGRTDVYACGVLMYEALTGELPIRGRNRRELLDLHQRQAPQSLRARRPDLPLPPELDAAVMRCLRKRMSDRPATAGELEQMLSAIPLEGLPDRYPPDVSRRPSRSATRTLKAVPSRPPRE
jgi:serine/threonine-protein kinase